MFNIIFLEKKIKDKYYVNMIKTLEVDKFSFFLKEIIIIELIENFKVNKTNVWVASKEINQKLKTFLKKNEFILCDALKEKSTPSRPNEKKYDILIRNVTSSNAIKNQSGLAHREEIEFCSDTKSYRLSNTMLNYNIDSVFDRIKYIQQYEYIVNYLDFIFRSEPKCEKCQFEDVVMLIPQTTKIVMPEDIKLLCPNCIIKENKEEFKNVHVKEK